MLGYVVVAIVILHLGMVAIFEAIDRRHVYRWKEDKLLYELSWPAATLVVMAVIYAMTPDDDTARHYLLATLIVAPMIYLRDLSLRSREERTPLREREWRYFRWSK